MRYWFLWFILGIVSLLGGFMALANPFAATLTAEMMTGYMFAIVGILIVLSAFYEKSWGGRITALLFGAALVVLGANLLAHPLRGILSLTYVAAIMMAVSGVLRIALALSSETKNLRGVLVFSGAVSLLLSGLIVANWPMSAAVVLGAFLAIELISNGVSLIVLSLMGKPEAEAV